MNKYNYETAVYEKAIQDINAKTKKIQEQDRTLELRLKQLDTEQEALQTEMEAVKKVIDKNIEETFKTFQ
jgi:predicted RNase H-like nuclease (RuvC/YqgF family)